nr:MAG TPA: hypothetical protein [Caudoviricetes sp.]
MSHGLRLLRPQVAPKPTSWLISIARESHTAHHKPKSNYLH